LTKRFDVGYGISIDRANCINCGVCMDVCPVQALDMTRPDRPGVEAGGGPGSPHPWMMEYPVQVGECIGCSICIRECPVEVMTLTVLPGPAPLVPRQGPITSPTPGLGPGWIPLSTVTMESLKPDHPEPFDGLYAWRTSERPQPWQVWRTMLGDSPADPVAPCQGACPAGTDAGRYVGLIAQGRYDEAYGVAAEVNPFPSVCGWICTAPCESACRRGTLDEPIAIRTLKRFAAEYGHLPAVPPPARRRAEKVAIVGGGPAGMSAAYYLARLGYPVTVFEAMPVPGGMMAIGIPEYRLPRDVLREEIARIVGLGVELRLDNAMGRDFSLSDLETDGFKAIFLATGASKSRPLDVAGDDLAGVVPATLFLKQVNLGEKPRLTGDVVVVGGGSTAMDAARSALRSGADKVTILYRRSRSDMPAQEEEIAAAEREGVALRTDTIVTAVLGRESVSGVQVQRQAATGETEEGRAVFAPVAGSEEDFPTATVLVAVGEEPDPSILPEGAGIGVSAFAGISADRRTLATSRAGVFAGGDVVSGPKTIIDAVGAGRKAAASIHEYLAGARDGEAEIFATVRYPTPPEPRLTLDLAVAPRAHAPLPVYEPGSFSAAQQGFDEPTARAEASRCFRCDAVYSCGTVEVVAGRGPREAPTAVGLPFPSGDESSAIHPAHTAGAPS
jgi:NADPH-dependent glutamate synthase beta subunit-like oxidoreductase/NAD-dependent dihydropyrimidine dehydrogenase PreA subunit